MKKMLPLALKTVAVLFAAGTAYLYYQNAQVPELGVENGRLKPLRNTPNCVSTQASDLEKRVEPLPFADNLEKTMAALKAAVHSYGHEKILEETDTYLRVVFTTPTLRFKDDAEFWLDVENQVVHFRSAARAGKSDLGMNRKRYEKLRELYLPGTVSPPSRV